MESHNILQIFDPLVELKSDSFLCFTLPLITKVMFISLSISIGLEFWSVNYISIYENSEFNTFKDVQVLDETSS